MNNNFFIKTHGLGNEYIVLDKQNITFELTEQAIKRICNVNFGIGSDGILLKVASTVADIGLRIFNPDGSEAEKSGNGLRIFCKYLFDYGVIDRKEFTVETKGGIVKATIEETTASGKAKLITVDMGRAIFEAALIPTRFATDEVNNETIEVGGKTFEVNAVSVGNPHCVILKDSLDVAEVKQFGPLIEHHPMFPNRINVQFAKIVNRTEVEVLIWERGAGFTQASGSSSCAVASVLRKKGLVDEQLTILMPGGSLRIHVGEGFELRMTGEVREICNGILSPELIEDITD